MPELIGTFEQMVLLAVLRMDAEAYGRSVLREVQRGVGAGREPSAGAVYTTLDRLETKRLLTSRLATGTAERGGRARRFYTLTAQGASALNDTRAALERMWQGKAFPLEALS